MFVFCFYLLIDQRCRSEGALCTEGEYGQSAGDTSAGNLRLHVPSSPWQGQLWQGVNDERKMKKCCL